MKQKFNHRCSLFSLLRQISQIEKKIRNWFKPPTWWDNLSENFSRSCPHVRTTSVHTCSMSCLLRFFQGLNTLSHYFLHNYQLFPLSWIIPSIHSNSFHLKQNHQNSPCDSIFPCNSWLDLFTYLISLSIYLISVTAKLLKDLFKQVICI